MAKEMGEHADDQILRNELDVLATLAERQFTQVRGAGLARGGMECGTGVGRGMAGGSASKGYVR